MHIEQTEPQVCDVPKVEGVQNIHNQKGEDHHISVVCYKAERKENHGQEPGREGN